MAEIIDEWTTQEYRDMHALSEHFDFDSERKTEFLCENPKCWKYCNTMFDKNRKRRRFVGGVQSELLKDQIAQFISGRFCYSCQNMLTIIEKESNIQSGGSSVVEQEGESFLEN